MISLRNVVLLKIGAGLMSPRLLSGSVDKGDAKKGKDGKKKKEKKKDFCGKVVIPTKPSCKNKPGEGKAKK